MNQKSKLTRSRGSSVFELNSLNRLLVISCVGLILPLSNSVFGQACGPGGNSVLPVDPGEIVATCSSGILGNFSPFAPVDLDGYVVAMLDTQNPDLNCVAGPLGNQWYRAPRFHNENINPLDPNIWNARNLGQVFGLALDDRAAANIYVSATTIYGELFDAATGNPTTFGPSGSGAIYRLDGNTGAICTLTTLPNDSEVGLGNMAFSPVGQYLYVSNMEDGLIYRVPTDECPQPANASYLTFDHGLDGRLAEEFTLIPDDTAVRYTPFGRRVWGLAVNEQERRLYYSVWWEHTDNGGGNASEDNEIWSVELNSAGEFVAGSARREFLQPPYFGVQTTGRSNPASDISFTPTGRLMVAERTRAANSGTLLTGSTNDAHRARVLEYSGSHLAWIASPINKYHIGRQNGDNCAGGVVVDCAENVWSSGDALNLDSDGGFFVAIYGLQRIPAGGNIGVIPPTRDSLLIDLDDDTTTSIVKTQMGDVTILNRCVECTFESDNILCELDEMGQLTGNNIVTGLFTNLQDIPGTHLFLPGGATSPDGVELCFGNGSHVLSLDPALNNGDSVEIGEETSNSDAIIIKNAMPGEEVCFRMVLLGENGIECCSLEVCFEMPPCDCLQIDRRFDEFTDIVCNADGTVDFSYSFQLTNLFGQDVYHSFLAPNGFESFTPDYFDLVAANSNSPLAQGQSVTLKTVISGALPGTPVDFLVAIHVEDLSECCSRDHDVMSPICDDVPGGQVQDASPGDVNEDGLVDLQDVQPFVDLLTTGGYSVPADINSDGVLNLSDVAPFVTLLTGASG